MWPLTLGHLVIDRRHSVIAGWVRRPSLLFVTVEFVPESLKEKSLHTPVTTSVTGRRTYMARVDRIQPCVYRCFTVFREQHKGVLFLLLLFRTKTQQIRLPHSTDRCPA